MEDKEDQTDRTSTTWNPKQPLSVHGCWVISNQPFPSRKGVWFIIQLKQAFFSSGCFGYPVPKSMENDNIFQMCF